MNPWLQLVAGQPAPAGVEKTDAESIVAPLTDLGLIAVAGEDAATFLHNQLTNDVEHLGTNQARLAGYCSPKGRLLASFLYWKQDNAVMLQVPHAIQPGIQKRLQMFVLRAKARLSDATADNALIGLAGPGAQDWLAQRFTEMPAEPYVVSAAESGVVIRLPDSAAGPRFQWVTKPDIAVAAWPELCSAMTRVDVSAWRLMDIQAGVPQIVAATQEKFVPQMINLELIGGVNFRKGCYPGQEIVARSQYLGKLKRRTLRALVSAPAESGMDVFSASDRTQPCGMIVNTEPCGGVFECLVELKLSARDAGPVHLGRPDGPQLEFIPLPYALTDPA